MIEIRLELARVREILKDMRDGGAPDSLINGMWHAQQSLLWVLGEGKSSSEIMGIASEIADHLPAEDGQYSH